jgi:hypothetical protein
MALPFDPPSETVMVCCPREVQHLHEPATFAELEGVATSTLSILMVPDETRPLTRAVHSRCRGGRASRRPLDA